MTNSDITRLINSDEIQSIVRPTKSTPKRASLKKNPLKNLGALLKLNPYAKTARRMELRAEVRIGRLRPCMACAARFFSAVHNSWARRASLLECAPFWGCHPRRGHGTLGMGLHAMGLLAWDSMPGCCALDADF
jgi:60S ribosomal protein L4 C-terminal domain